MEHKSLNVHPRVHSKILAFRGFLMSHGVDCDYSTAFNILAEHGFDSLQMASLPERLLELLSEKLNLGPEATKALSAGWPGRIVVLPVLTSESLNVGGSKRPRGESMHPPSANETPKVSGFCLSCRKHRVMLEPHIIVGKGGREMVAGRCPVCSKKMVLASLNAVKMLKR